MRALELAAIAWVALFLVAAFGLIGHALIVDQRARAMFGLLALGLSPMACVVFLAWRLHVRAEAGRRSR